MAVFNFARLLRLIADSQALRLHLAISERGWHLFPPKLEEFPEFARSFNLDCHHPLMRVRHSEAAGNEEDEDVAAVDDPISEERIHLATFYRSRIRKQVAHFGALQILEEYCRMRSDTFANFEVPLIAVKSNQPKTMWGGIMQQLKKLELVMLSWMRIKLKWRLD